jgi:cytoskeletal protein RodZ
MTPKLRLVLEIAGGILALLALGAYISSREDRVRMEATQKAQNDYQAQLKQLSADFDAKLKARDDAYKHDSRELADKFNGSMAQVLALISQRANLPVPLTETTPAPTKDNPNPSPIINIPKADFSAAAKYAQDCEQCKLDRVKLQADAADRQKQAQLAQRQIDSLKQERDAAVKAAKGGTWIQRLGHNAKWLAIGAAAGAIAARAHP